MANAQPTHVMTSELPSGLLAEASEAILRHTVALLAVRDTGDGGKLDVCGTATLVNIKGVRCLLTAAHVWDHLREVDAIGLGMIEERHRPFIDPRKVIADAKLGPGRRCWLGPDLAVLFSEEAIGKVEAYGKAFLDLSKRREAMLAHPLALDYGVWALAGAPLAASKSDGQLAHLYMGPYFSGVDRVKIRDGFDYFDVGVNYATNPDAPRSFEGVSGGGLWRVVLVPGPDGSVSWNHEPRLEGVAFYQTARKGDRRLVRCHGTRSLYATLLDAIGNANQA